MAASTIAAAAAVVGVGLGCGLGVAAGCAAVVAASAVRARCVIGVAAAYLVVACLRKVGGASIAVDARSAVGCVAGSTAIGADAVGAGEAGPAGVSGDVGIGAAVGVEATTVADVAVGTVVPEATTAPVSAVEADAEVAEAVVDAAVVADDGAPVAGVPVVAVVAVAPVAGGPKCSGIGSSDPCAVDPLIAVGRPGPVAGGPDVAIAGGRRLRVVGDGGRSLVDALRCAVWRHPLLGTVLEIVGILSSSVLAVRVVVLICRSGVLRVLSSVLVRGGRGVGSLRHRGYGSEKERSSQRCGTDGTREEVGVRHNSAFLPILRLSGAAWLRRASRRARMRCPPG
jgi:hypothetical protein